MLTKPNNRFDQKNPIKCYISEKRSNQVVIKFLPVNMPSPLVRYKITFSAVGIPSTTLLEFSFLFLD